jgi:hypothetical protein
MAKPSASLNWKTGRRRRGLSGGGFECSKALYDLTAKPIEVPEGALEVSEGAVEVVHSFERV